MVGIQSVIAEVTLEAVIQQERTRARAFDSPLLATQERPGEGPGVRCAVRCIRCSQPIDPRDILDGARACWDCRENSRALEQYGCPGIARLVERRYSALITAFHRNELPECWQMRGERYDVQASIKAALDPHDCDAEYEAIRRDLYYLNEWWSWVREGL